ncbi:NAD(P)-dependent oxidoreductase [Pseudomonadales bacterium]|nr:NAD(P)-dependent oxidoreductase [Pseudomonadales bacterium]
MDNVSRVVWVTGSSGYLGRHICRKLEACGYQVIGFGGSSWPDGLKFEDFGIYKWFKGFVSTAAMNEALAAYGPPDRIFHFAGPSTVSAAMEFPEAAYESSVQSTEVVLDWLTQTSQNTTFIMASSAAVYGRHNQGGPISESSELKPLSSYGKFKLEAEKKVFTFLRKTEFNFFILRIFSVFGEGLKKQILWDSCVRLGEGLDYNFHGTGRELRDFIEVNEFAAAIEQLTKDPLATRGIYNIGSGVGTSIEDLVNLLSVVWDGHSQIRANFTGIKSEIDPDSLVADISRLRSHGINIQRLKEQFIEDYISWVKKTIC